MQEDERLNEDDGLVVEEGAAARLNRKDQWTRIVLSTVLLGFIGFVVIDSFTNHFIKDITVSFIQWVGHNPGQGVLAVIFVYILATILFVPGSILTLGAGFAFGSAFQSTGKAVALAATAVFIGAFLGSICAFLLGRYLFKDCVQRLASRYTLFTAIDRALEGNGLKIMILLRLSPIVPYTALDYLSGLTSISLWHYSLALFACLPGTIVFCFMGATASSISSAGENHAVKTITLGLGVAFALIGVGVASYYSKKELDKILLDEGQSDSSQLITSEHEYVTELMGEHVE